MKLRDEIMMNLTTYLDRYHSNIVTDDVLKLIEKRIDSIQPEGIDDSGYKYERGFHELKYLIKKELK